VNCKLSLRNYKVQIGQEMQGYNKFSNNRK